VKGVVSNMKSVECRTAAEVYSALKAGNAPNIIEGCFAILIEEGAHHLIVSGKASPTIECWGSVSTRIKCRNSSSPRIKCRNFSTPIIECWEESAPKIEAKDDSHIRFTHGNPHITATPSVQVSVLRGNPIIVGTTQIFRVTGETPKGLVK
jgi:hypothetical protein